MASGVPDARRHAPIERKKARGVSHGLDVRQRLQQYRST